MKIALLSASIEGLGGAEALVRMLANGLAERGHEVQVISLDPAGSRSGTETDRFESFFLNSRASDQYALRESKGPLFKAWWQLRCLGNAALIKQLEALLSEQRPDIVHTHKVRGFPRNLWSRLKNTLACPVVHTCHDIELLSPLHTIAVRTRNPLTWAFLRAWSGLARPASTSVDVVTSPSEFMLGLHNSARLFGRAGSKVVSNFPDLAGAGDFTALQNPAPDEALKILFLGRLVKVKGILALCEAVVQANRASGAVELRIAGDGPLLGKMIQYQDQHPFIRYEGVVRGKGKSELLDWAHVVAAPAQYDETFCLVAAEAISACRPVLASSRGGLPEVVSDGNTGWVYQGQGVDALLAGLHRVLESRDQLADYSVRCQAGAARFTSFGLIGDYESIYRDLVQPKQEAA